MRLLDPVERRSLGGLLPPEQPGPIVAAHVLETGLGACFADRWPEPRVLVAGVVGNYELYGDPAALTAGELAEQVAGFVTAPPAFEPLLREAHPDLGVWDRVILELDRAPAVEPRADGVEVRRLGAEDAWQVFGLSDDVDWIAKTLSGPAGMAASGLAWGAFVEGRLASVSTPFFRGSAYEDVGVVTEAEHRGRGLSPACAAGVAQDVLARGRTVSWSTAPENAPSLAVARKLGFREVRRDVLYLAREPVPETATPAD